MTVTDSTGGTAAIEDTKVETQEQEVVKADEAKPEDEVNKAAFVKDGKLASPSAEPRQARIAADGSEHLTKRDAVKRNLEIETEEKLAPSLAKMEEALSKADTKAETDTKLEEEVVKATPPEEEKTEVEKTTKTHLVKGLSEVARAACLIQELEWFHQCLESEAEWERDNSPQPAALKSIIADLCTFLKALVAEETAELFDGGDEVTVMAMAAKMTGSACDTLAKYIDVEKVKSTLSKAGARHSTADKENLMAIHKSATDHLGMVEKCFKEAGVMPDEVDEDKATQKMSKVLATLSDTLAKNTALETVITKTSALLEKTAGVVDALVDEKKQLATRIDHLERQPAAAKGYVRVVAKTQDTGATGDGDAAEYEARLQKMSPEQRSKELMKLALSAPMAVAS
jgi:hypothetical protein